MVGSDPLTHPPSSALDYSSGFLCRLPLKALQGWRAGLEVGDPSAYGSLMGGTVEVSDQSHLTQVVIGCEEDPQECPPTEEIVQQVRVVWCVVKGHQCIKH